MRGKKMVFFQNNCPKIKMWSKLIISPKGNRWHYDLAKKQHKKYAHWKEENTKFW